MYDRKRILAIIPARGGSKGLPRKNVLPLLGKPLIAWSIDAAKASAFLDEVIVSTDDNEIAAVAKQFGAEIPFIRPRELASDSAKTLDVILHALSELATRGQQFEVLVLLQPTSPLRTSGDIDAVIRQMFSHRSQAVVSVCETEHHPYWSNVLGPDGSMADFLRPELLNRNRQELPRFYRLNGAVYAGYSEYVRAQNGFFGKGTSAYVMPQNRSIDIDTRHDFEYAEFVLQKELQEHGKEH